MEPTKLLKPGVRALVWMQRLIAAAIAVFWVVFWLASEQIPPVIVDFEANFPIPDLLWIAGLLLCSSYWLKREDWRGPWAAAAAAGALVFLGLLDATFNWRHGQYSSSPAIAALNVVINVGCVGFGLWSLVVVARSSKKREQ